MALKLGFGAEDGTYPTSIRGLAAALGLCFDAVLVRCKFCRNTLNYFDLSNFDSKDLRLIWCDLTVFGICCTCTRVSASAETEGFYDYSLLAVQLLREDVLKDICVRCYRCYSLLGYSEKLHLAFERQLIHKVRKGWRGVCRNCRIK